MKQEKKRKLWKIGIPILVGIILLMGASYAWFILVLNGNKMNVIKTGKLSLILGEEGSTISLENTFPITTEEGLQSEGYTFEVKNDGNLTSQYTLYFDDDNLETGEERIDPKYIRYSLEKDNALVTENGSALLSSLKNNELIKGIISPEQTHKYKLKLWIDNDADNEAMNKAFRRKLRIEGEILEVDGSCFAVNGSTITGYNAKDSEGNACPKDVVIPSRIRGSSITSIGTNAFTHKELTSVVIPSTVKTIGPYAFAANHLTHIVIPPSVITIEYGAFRDNQLPDEEAFIYNRKSDGSIDYTSLNSYAGAKRDDVVIPNNVKILGTASLYNCLIQNVILPEGLTKISSSALSDNRLTHLKIPSTVISMTGNSIAGNQLVDEDAFIYKRTSSGEDRSYLLAYGGARKENVIIPDNVKVIGSNSFAATEIRSITIPEGVTSIENYAFLRNQLTSIVIPSSVTYIGGGAFSGNEFPYDEKAWIYQRNADGTENKSILVSYASNQKENIIVPSTVTTISQNAFRQTYITDITLPSRLEKIEGNAFGYTNLSQVELPNSVTFLGLSAFGKVPGSNNKLTKIINTTGRSFDWGSVINGKSGYEFITGTVQNSVGNVTITSS